MINRNTLFRDNLKLEISHQNILIYSFLFREQFSFIRYNFSFKISLKMLPSSQSENSTICLIFWPHWECSSHTPLVIGIWKGTSKPKDIIVDILANKFLVPCFINTVQWQQQGAVSECNFTYKAKQKMNFSL